jgi:predicted cobalt transporter CbtA
VGFERAAYTVLADLLAGIGFGFLLTATIALAGLRGYVVDARRGI